MLKVYTLKTGRSCRCDDPQLTVAPKIVTMTMASQITGILIVCSTIWYVEDQRKHQSSPSLAFVRGIHQWPVVQWQGKCFHLMTSSWVLPPESYQCYTYCYPYCFEKESTRMVSLKFEVMKRVCMFFSMDNLLEKRFWHWPLKNVADIKIIFFINTHTEKI